MILETMNFYILYCEKIGIKNNVFFLEKRESLRQDSVESGATISTVHSGATVHSCIVDEKGKTQLKS
jgi:hypothetical protein